MTEDKLLSVKEVCRILGISESTLRRWEREGKIKVIRTPGGKRRIPESEVKKLLGEKEEKLRTMKIRCVIYARVSGNSQKDDLERQIEALKKYALERNYEVIDIITDIASGLKTNRKGLKKLFKYVIQRRINVVLITWKDRLTRFGFEYLEYFFKQFGVKIECIFKEEKTPIEELIEDFVSIVTSFAARIYGKRSKKVQQFLKHVKNFLKTDFTWLQ